MRGSNLHAVWDSGLLRQLDLENQALVALVQKVPLPGADARAPMARAAEESCRLVAQAGFYPAERVDQAYLAQFSPLVLERLALAARRLGWVLDSAPRQARPFLSPP
jgi:hypothetical protein